MNNNKISGAVDTAFDAAFKTWNHQIENDLYPSAFTNPHSWLAVKNSLEKNNNYLKEAMKQALYELLAEK